jgi:eukaryotic-like serine/threonine-protein kinase
MTIAPGTRLGPYELASRIGAGSMGEVWRARDTRLDRSVALKMLPAGSTLVRDILDPSGTGTTSSEPNG